MNNNFVVFVKSYKKRERFRGKYSRTTTYRLRKFRIIKTVLAENLNEEISNNIHQYFIDETDL